MLINTKMDRKGIISTTIMVKIIRIHQINQTNLNSQSLFNLISNPFNRIDKLMSNHISKKNNQINNRFMIINTESLIIRTVEMFMTENQTEISEAIMKHMTTKHRANLPQDNKLVNLIKNLMQGEIKN